MAQPRPYIRNPMIRTLYEHQTDTKFNRRHIHRNFNVHKWYTCSLDAFPADIREKFCQCHMDVDTEKFLDLSYEKSDWILTQAWHSFVKAIFGMFMSATSINGLLHRGTMFVFSTNQFRSLLGIDSSFTADCLLDLGAGDGQVTQKMAGHFKTVYATEVSHVMQNRLRQCGYIIRGLDEWTRHSYDVINCLNLLDRCDRPATILSDIHRSLVPGGVAIVALVLPYKPFVETSSHDQNEPSEILHVHGKTWEEQSTSIVTDVFTPAGFTVHSFTKLPYLCEGDVENPFYVLQDAVFVIRRTEDVGMPLPQASSSLAAGAGASDVLVDLPS